MRVDKVLSLIIVLALALALPLSEGFAGTTGKITGRVTDRTGGPLPGANVVVEGTRRGAMTDADGFYVVLSVAPGKYSLTASMVGYNKVTKQNANVTVDYTTRVDFSLDEQAIEAAEIVVTAERPPVELDKTSTKYIVDASDIAQTPIVKTTGEMVSLQPGVDMAGTYSVRGSDISLGVQPNAWGTQTVASNDVYVLIDGVRVPNNDGHSAILFTGVNKSAVQQISVETGVSAAEYGDAQGGTINIVTQEGASSYHGWMEANYEPAGKKHWGANVYHAADHRDHMKWDDPTWLAETDPLTGRLIHVEEDYTSYNGYSVEGSLSGPIGPSVSFMASAKHEYRAPVYPSATNHGFYNDRGHYVNAPNNIQGSVGLTWKPSANMKVKTGMIFQRYTAYNDEVNEYGYANEGFVRGMRQSGRNLFLPKDWAASGQHRDMELLNYVTFTHTVSPKTFYEIRLSRSVTSQDTMGAPPWTGDSRKDDDGWFIIDRQVAMWIDSERERWSLKADVSSQMSKGNFVKAGMEFTRFNSSYIYWGARSKSDNWFTFYSGGDEPWDMESRAQPIRGALYVQDKMEFEGLIVNAGVRLDFNKHTHKELMRSGLMWAPMWRVFTNRHYAYGVGTADGGLVVQDDFSPTPPFQWFVSPRLGISHPITERMVMHFSLGRFVQWMDIYDLYAKSYRNFGVIGPDGDPNWSDVNGDGVRQAAERLSNMLPHYSGFGGDPWAQPEETLTFEVGADWNFVSDYTTSLTLFYRNETNQGTHDGTHWLGAKRGSHYTRGLGNGRAAYAKGLELAIGKRLSNYFSFRVAWSSQWSAFGNMGLTQYGASTVGDSMFAISNEFWYDFRANADGSTTAIPVSADEKPDLGHIADNYIRSWINTYTADRFNMFGKIPQLKDKAVWIRYNALGGNRYGPMGAWAAEKTGGILGQANVQFVLNTPSDINMGARWLGWLVSDLNANLLWKLRTGQRFTWTPPRGERLRGRGPVNTVTDMSLEKVFNAKSRLRPTFFIEVRNLFNTQTDTGGGTDYARWGLQMARPDNSDYLEYGDLGDRSYYNAPRKTNLGLRLTF